MLKSTPNSAISASVAWHNNSHIHHSLGIYRNDVGCCVASSNTALELIRLSDAKPSSRAFSSDFALSSVDCVSCRAGARLFTFSATTGFVRPWQTTSSVYLWRAAIFMARRPASSASATVENVSNDGSAHSSKQGWPMT